RHSKGPKELCQSFVGDSFDHHPAQYRQEENPNPSTVDAEVVKIPAPADKPDKNYHRRPKSPPLTQTPQGFYRQGTQNWEADLYLTIVHLQINNCTKAIEV
ncbi:MAG: hypothetical protein ACPGC6_03510, partial [Flavobacteriaceae bacterium]